MQSAQTYVSMFLTVSPEMLSRTTASTAATISIPSTVRTDENAPGATSEMIEITVFRSHPASNDEAIPDGVTSSPKSGR